MGVAVNSASTGQPVEYASAGDVTMTVTAPAGYLKPGEVYVLGSAAGTISPSADLDATTNTRYGTIIGIGVTATKLRLAIMASGVKNP